MTSKKPKTSFNLVNLFHKFKELIRGKKKDKSAITPYGEFDEDTKQENIIATNADNFEEKTAEDVMVPRSDISAVSDNIGP